MKIMSLLFILIFFSIHSFSEAASRDFAHSNHNSTLDYLGDDFYKLKLTDSERNALYNYALDYYREINPALRSFNTKAINEYKYEICAMDTAILKYNIKNLTLYRGLNYLPKGSDKVGFVFNQNAYTSTSINKAIALNFAMKNQPYVLDIIKTSNNPFYGIWLNYLSEFNEEEILLARDTSFKVESVEIKRIYNQKVVFRTLSIVEQDISKKMSSILNCSNK